MASRGHLRPSFEGRPIQAPGMLRHGPYPGVAPAVHRSYNPPHPELLENKMVLQAAEIERLARENRRLAETHVALRQELAAAQKEMHRLQDHIESVHTESNIQGRGLLEKIGKLEAEINAGEMVKKELQQAHTEAQSLFAAREELTAEIQHVTEELQRNSTEMKNMPELHAELDQLRQEHQKLRTTFEHEKGANMEQVQQMQVIEKNLVSMAGEVEKLRADVANAEKRARAPNAYGGAFGTSPDPAYPSAGQGIGYGDGGGYGQGGFGGGYGDASYGHVSGGYKDGSYGQGGPTSYPDAYGRHQVQQPSGAMLEGLRSYGGVGSGSYSDGYGRSQVQMTGGAPMGEGLYPSYGVSGGGAPYEVTRGALTSARR